MKCFKMALILLVLLSAAYSHAQVGHIQGNLVDEHNRPIIGATVIVKDSTDVQKAGILSDYEGNYQIDSLSAGCYTLEITFLGNKLSKLLYVLPNTLTEIAVIAMKIKIPEWLKCDFGLYNMPPLINPKVPGSAYIHTSTQISHM